MFVGHIGVGLMLKRTERRASLGVLFLATMLLDLLLWVFVLVGVEQVTIPPDFEESHYLTFVFPYSHGLLATLGWSVLAGGLVWLVRRRRAARPSAAALAVTLAVFSHFVLDAVVHVPELPLVGAGSLRFGLGLWNVMPVALGLEVGIALLGLLLYLKGGTGAGVDRRRIAAVIVLVTLLSGLTVVGGTVGPPPPTAAAAAVPALVSILLVAAAGFWIDSPAKSPAPEGGAQT